MKVPKDMLKYKKKYDENPSLFGLFPNCLMEIWNKLDRIAEGFYLKPTYMKFLIKWWKQLKREVKEIEKQRS